MFPYLIPIAVLSQITGTKVGRLRKMYEPILANDCIPLTEIPFTQQETFARDYLLRNCYVDIDLMQCTRDDTDWPCCSAGVQQFFHRSNLVRKMLSIQNAFAAERTVTIHLTELATENGFSYRTLMRERSRFMSHTSLMNLLSDPNKGEDTVDRYRKCCFYCRDYIIARHESAGHPSDNSILRETKHLSDFSCSKCPYHPDVKAAKHSKSDIIPAATCRRNSAHMIVPQTRDTVNTITNRIPEQETYMAWAGVRAWMSKCQHTIPRIKPETVNFCWFSDHTLLDIMVKTKTYKDGHFDCGRVWLTGIMDIASNALVGYVLSTNPNAELIAHAFATASAFKPDSPFHGICQYWYCDNGKDYRADLLKGHPHHGSEPPLYLNKDFSESGFLEWLGVSSVQARVFNGRAKPIERVWRIIEDEFICKMQGYCGNNPASRPESLYQDMKSGNLYSFEQFADIFADVIYPGYNNFKASGEKESPMERYLRLPKAKTIVPSWRTLAVLKKKKKSCAVHPDGIHYCTLNGKPVVYWHPGLARFIRPQKPYEKVQVYAFDEPFNRSLAIVYGQVYIGEAHPVQGLNLIEERRYRVIQHLQEQSAQLRTYSSHIKKIRNIVLQNNLAELGTGIPAVDNVAYGQPIDEEKDRNNAVDDQRIPEELKHLAEQYQEINLEPEAPDLIGDFLARLGRNE